MSLYNLTFTSKGIQIQSIKFAFVTTILVFLRKTDKKNPTHNHRQVGPVFCSLPNQTFLAQQNIHKNQKRKQTSISISTAGWLAESSQGSLSFSNSLPTATGEYVYLLTTQKTKN